MRSGLWAAPGCIQDEEETRCCDARDASGVVGRTTRPMSTEPLSEGGARVAVFPTAALAWPGTRNVRKKKRPLNISDRCGEPTGGFEPSTCCLRNSCSTTELRRHRPTTIP